MAYEQKNEFMLSLLQECECNGSILYDSLSKKNIGECLTEDPLSSTYEPSFFCFVNPQVQCNDKKHWKNGAFISYRACDEIKFFVPKIQVKDENEYWNIDLPLF